MTYHTLQPTCFHWHCTNNPRPNPLPDKTPGQIRHRYYKTYRLSIYVICNLSPTSQQSQGCTQTWVMGAAILICQGSRQAVPPWGGASATVCSHSLLSWHASMRSFITTHTHTHTHAHTRGSLTHKSITCLLPMSGSEIGHLSPCQTCIWVPIIMQTRGFDRGTWVVGVGAGGVCDHTNDG